MFSIIFPLSVTKPLVPNTRVGYFPQYHCQEISHENRMQEPFFGIVSGNLCILHQINSKDVAVLQTNSLMQEIFILGCCC